MKGKFVTIPAVMTVDGTLDLDAALTTHVDSVIKTVDNSVPVTLAFTGDSQYDNGKLDESAYPAIVFHFKSGVTTVSDFEEQVEASRYVILVTPGTGANVMDVPSDDFAATTFASGTMNAANDACVVDLTGMTGVSLYVNQVTDSGTVTLVVEKSIDGVNWASAHANLTEASFPAGNNKSFEITMSDANGMPLMCKQARVTVSAYGASGVYTLVAAGTLVDGYR